jgi:hypothetical protein
MPPLYNNPYSYITAGSSNQDAQQIKTSGGVLKSCVAFCTVATPRYLKIYDLSASPTSANTPILRLAIPANSTSVGGFVLPLPPDGMTLFNGLAFRVTQNLPDNDATACAANDVVLNMVWQ